MVKQSSGKSVEREMCVNSKREIALLSEFIVVQTVISLEKPLNSVNGIRAKKNSNTNDGGEEKSEKS